MSIKNKLEDILEKHPVWSGIATGGVTAGLTIYDFIVDSMKYGLEHWQDTIDLAFHFGLPTSIGLLTAYGGKELKQIRNRKKIEANLKETLEFNKKIISGSPIGMSVYDKSGQCIEANDSFGELIGATREQVLKQNYNNIKSWKGSGLLNKAKSAIKNNEKNRHEIKTISTFGKDIILDCYLVPFGQGELLLMLDDIRERKKIEKALQKSEEKHITLLENIPQKIFYKDINSVYISCNENYARDLKIKANEIFGKSDFDFYPKELAEKYKGDDKRIIKTGKIENIEEKYIQDRKEVIVNTVKTPVRDESQNIIGILGIFWDITERIKAEETINRMRKEQEIYLRHEFGNIHNIISCNAELVIRYNDKINNLTEDQKELVHSIRKTSKRAINLINSLKQIQEFERGNYNINKVDYDLNSLVKISVNNYKILETKHDVGIDYNNNSNNSEIKLDPHLMSSVFDNLIKNAVEHVSELKDKAEKYVKVDVYNKNDKLFVKINNKGKEIPPDRLKTFFEKFNSTKPGGTGVGTALAYQITKAHGGDIYVDSNKQDGTTVTLEFKVS